MLLATNLSPTQTFDKNRFNKSAMFFIGVSSQGFGSMFAMALLESFGKEDLLWAFKQFDQHMEGAPKVIITRYS